MIFDEASYKYSVDLNSGIYFEMTDRRFNFIIGINYQQSASDSIFSICLPYRDLQPFLNGPRNTKNPCARAAANRRPRHCRN